MEQSVEYALTLSDDVYIMHEGRIVAHGSAREIQESEVRRVYLGV